MKQNLVKELAEILSENGYTSKVRSYSGRGMFGKECISISTDASEYSVLDFLQEVNEDRLIKDSLRTPRFDSLGRGIVVYWPDIEPEPED